MFFFFFSSRRRHTRFSRDWSSDVCSSDLSEVPVTRRKPLEQRPVENRRRAWRDRVHAVLLIDRLTQHDAPAPLALFEEIVEPPGAEYVAQHTLDLGALRDRHLGLRDCALSCKVDRDSAEEMQ